MVRLAPHDFPFQPPSANHVIDEIVPPFRGTLRNRTSGRRRNEQNYKHK
jgi:hypothetical protein